MVHQMFLLLFFYLVFSSFFLCVCRFDAQLMTTEGNAWLYKNKDHGMMSAAASLGTILLWNVEEGLTQVGVLHCIACGREGGRKGGKGSDVYLLP